MKDVEGPLPATEAAHRRLQQLYDISKLLTRFESVEPAVTEVLALATKAVPLHITVLALQEAPRPRMIVWPVEGVSRPRLHAARARARAGLDYLVGGPDPGLPDRGLEEDMSALPLPGVLSPSTEGEDRYLLLPLVVDKARIFGLLLLEGAARMDEADLSFLNAVANQLAVAIDRLLAVESRQARAEAARATAERAAVDAARSERGQRLLSETSALLGATLDFRKSLRAVLRAAVPFLADVCYLDELTEDGGIECPEVVFADPGMVHLAERFRHRANPPNPHVPLARVLSSGESVLLEDIPVLRHIAHDEAHAELLEETGVRAWMTVPLHARGRTLGALTFLSAESGRRFTHEDLQLAEEIGRRTALASDNSRLYAESRRAIQTRQHLLAVVSHDLKNPLGALLMGTAMLLETPGLSERDRKLLEAMRRGGLHMDRLITDLLDVAALEGGHLVVDKKRHRVGDLVDEALESNMALATQKGLMLRGEVADAAQEIAVDKVRMLQVFGNLLGNAIKFTPAGGTIRVEAERIGPDVRFSVADTGPGIATNSVGKVFQPYWQASGTAHLGTGLGLSVAKGLVEAHGGRIWVESRPGDGATFFFTVPAPG